jgi:hypothetical protein
VRWSSELTADGKGTVVKEDMTGDMDVASGVVIASIAFVVWGVAKEHARQGPLSKLMWRGGCCIGETEASKEALCNVVGVDTVEKKKWHAILPRPTRAAIEEVSGCAKGLYPESVWHGSLNKDGTNDVVNGTESTLGHPF